MKGNTIRLLVALTVVASLMSGLLMPTVACAAVDNPDARNPIDWTEVVMCLVMLGMYIDWWSNRMAGLRGAVAGAEIKRSRIKMRKPAVVIKIHEGKEW